MLLDPLCMETPSQIQAFLIDVRIQFVGIFDVSVEQLRFGQLPVQFQLQFGHWSTKIRIVREQKIGIFAARYFVLLGRGHFIVE